VTISKLLDEKSLLSVRFSLTSESANLKKFQVDVDDLTDILFPFTAAPAKKVPKKVAKKAAPKKVAPKKVVKKAAPKKKVTKKAKKA
jgi:hypothetical protein